MPRPRQAPVALLLALVLAAVGGGAGEAKDPLAAEMDRWAGFLRGNTASDDLWKDIKQGSELALARGEKALREGRPLLALQRFAAPRQNLVAAAWMQDRPAAPLTDTAAFEAEWKRMGSVLADELRPPPADALSGVRPAAVRGLGEAALPQVRVYYDASLDYGRNTMPQYGVFYLGTAEAARDFARFCRTLSRPTTLAEPPLRALGAELDELQGELLAAYRPPASVEKHPEFIASSAALKEARELDAAGLRYGALLRYLQAALRSAPLRAAPLAGDLPALKRRYQEAEARLALGNVDHSLARVFLESAAEDLGAAEGQTPAGAVTAAAVLQDVLPRYFRALEPPRPASSRPSAEVTVTLVRWPYT
jgi:hypothetical protein